MPSAAANITLDRPWQILQSLPSKTFGHGQFILPIQVVAKGWQYAIANIYEMIQLSLEFGLCLKK